ncbi:MULTISPECIES: hypothetical protein [Pseudomonas]|uniref:hypothetical protein n=1 Tax=Pseudomonas TaxID=286 RepID=UPI0006B5A766|nr:hypothetical protein [Pseudomonas fuscovaginae]
METLLKGQIRLVDAIEGEDFAPLEWDSLSKFAANRVRSLKIKGLAQVSAQLPRMGCSEIATVWAAEKSATGSKSCQNGEGSRCSEIVPLYRFQYR